MSTKLLTDEEIGDLARRLHLLLAEPPSEREQDWVRTATELFNALQYALSPVWLPEVFKRVETWLDGRDIHDDVAGLRVSDVRVLLMQAQPKATMEP